MRLKILSIGLTTLILVGCSGENSPTQNTLQNEGEQQTYEASDQEGQEIESVHDNNISSEDSTDIPTGSDEEEQESSNIKKIRL